MTDLSPAAQAVIDPDDYDDDFENDNDDDFDPSSSALSAAERN